MDESTTVALLSVAETFTHDHPLLNDMVDFNPEYMRRFGDKQTFGMNAPRFMEYHGEPL